MFAQQLPSFLVFGERPGLIISDDEVSLVVWKGGELRQVAAFPNDDKGVALFGQHLVENPYRNKGFFVIANIIGEDYRSEHVPHLTGTAKAGFHNRRMRSLFRGSSFFLSELQGREERGKREDIVLFFGLLAASKIDPWLAAIAKDGVRYVTGVHGMPHVASFLRPMLPKTRQDSVLITFHENDTVRLTFFAAHKLRFSRIAKVSSGSDAAALAATIKKELERTMQYLNTMRAFMEGRLTVDCICPGSMTGPLAQALPSAGRLEYRFHSAEALYEQAGIKKPLTETGRDSSLHVNALCRRIVFRQLAPQRQIMHYWIQIGARTAMVLFCLYGAYAYANAGITFSEGFFSYVAENEETERTLNEEKTGYQSDVQSLGDKPSTGENVRAVATTFDMIEAQGLTPTRLLYYLSGALAQNADIISVNNVKWYVSPEAVAPPSDGVQVISGGDFYQILEVQGAAQGGTQRQVFENTRQFVESFDKRGDVFIEEREMPPEQLNTLLDEDTELEREFILRIIWRDGEDFPPSFDPRAEEQEQQGGAG
ncbi:MAG: hypothetical protein ACR2P4_07440 [Gammaproteobacteria bacterium]